MPKMFWVMLEKYLFLTVCFRACQANGIFKQNYEVLSEGEEKLKELHRFTLSPYGSCWTSALARLKTSCPDLNEESHGRLAFSFSNCFMVQLGFKSAPCDDYDDLSSCLENVKSDTRWFTAYLQYHTHTHNMCYFLNHQLWLQKTENTIKKLTVSSDEIGKRLEESSDKQLELIRLQSDSVQAQKSLLEQGQVLNLYLENSKSSIAKVFDEFKQSAEGQQTLVMDMLNKLSSWIQFLVAHVTSIYTVAFYFVISFVLFIVTATPRTSKARAWLIFLWLSVYMSELTLKYEYSALWYMRYTGMIASVVLLLYFGMVYTDFETLNNRLLNELYRMVLTQVQLPQVQEPQQSVVPKWYNFVPDYNMNRVHLNTSSIKEICDDGSDSDSSSDATYTGHSESESDESTASFCSFSSSAASSRPLTPLLDISLNSSGSCGPLVPVSTEPTQSSPYNLRPRRSTGGVLLNNSIISKESAKVFGEWVKMQERNSKFQSLLQSSLKHPLTNSFSESK